MSVGVMLVKSFIAGFNEVILNRLQVENWTCRRFLFFKHKEELIMKRIIMIAMSCILLSACVPLTGKEYYPSGALRTVVNYKGGRPDGITKRYYESGKLMQEIKFNYGKAESSKLYYESGKLKSEANFKHGKQEGLQRDYYESGRLMWEGTFKDGKRQGGAKAYYESGKLRADVNFKDDKQLSMVCYDEQGKIITCPSH